MKALISWSGGKDSCYAMQQAKTDGIIPVALLNMMNENGQRSRSHALSTNVLHAQAAALGLPIVLQPSTWTDYENHFINNLKQIKADYQIEAVVFGDIDLQAHRDWEEKVCAAAGLKAILPLWQLNRKQLVTSMINDGIAANIVSCNTTMGVQYLGRVINQSLVTDAESIGVDACGENGEYHTVVTNCKLFKQPLALNFIEPQIVDNYCFIKATLQN